jgi:hypothetical protein
VDRHAGEHPPALGRLADAEFDDLVRAAVVDAVAAQRDLALPRPKQARDGPQGGGLAGAVGADEGDDLALLDREGDPAQCMDRAVVGVDVPEF